MGALERIVEIMERAFPGEVDFQASGSTATTITKSSAAKKWKSINITNDGSEDLTFTINSLTSTVKPGEIFNDKFVPFSSVVLNSSIAYRLWLRV